jgi:aminopeptidase N
VTEHLALDLSLDFKHKAVQGKASLSIRREGPLDHVLVLDAVGFAITKVLLVVGSSESEPEFEYDGEQLRVPIPKSAKRANVVIHYSAKPRRGLYFLAPDKQVSQRPVQVWSQCQDEDARHWFPCQDKPHVKMTTEVQVEVPHGFVALSNGHLVSSETPKAARSVWRYHFRLEQPHPSYLMTLVVGQFAVLEDEAVTLSGRVAPVPVSYYVPKGREADGWRAFADTPKMIRLFSELTGVPYPWDSYAQVVVSDFIFGGMENTTATTMYEHILLDERAALDITSNDLVAHELAHQWFGDYLTCRDWSHAWLNEGFATFFEHIEREHRLGRDEYEYGIAGDVETYLGEAQSRYERPIVCRDYQEPIDLFDRHLYEKGGLVLHQLRRELGDEVFWSGVKSYLTTHAGGIVETTDLVRAFEKVSGRSLERFFDQWVYRPGHPVLKIKVSYEDRVLVVHLKQNQKTEETAVFSLPLSIRVVHADKQVTLHERCVESASDTLVVACDARPLWIEVDPDFRLIGNLSISGPADFLRAQLADGSSARMRWMAARALGEKDDMLGIEALGRALGDEAQAWMVRAEAARALGRIRGADAFALLEPQAKAKHPKVRRAVAAALGNFRTPEAFRVLGQRCKADPSYLVRSTAADAMGATRQPGAAARLVALLSQDSWADVVRAGALSGLARTRDETALDAVFEMSAYGVPTRARRAAISALPQLSEGRKVREHLERLLDDAGPHVRISAIDALEVLGDEKGKSALRRHLRRELDGRVSRRAREALRNLGEGGAGPHKKLADDVETLRHELVELRTKLAKLEGSRRAGPDKAKPGEAPAPRASKKKSASSAARARARKAGRGK